jgi:general secretion pathway protein E
MPTPNVSELKELAARFHCRAVERVEESWLDRSLMEGLSVDFLRSGPMLPLRVEGQVLVCTPDPMVDARFPELALLLKGSVEPLLAPESEVRRAIDRCFSKVEPTAEPEAEADKGPGAEREDLLRQSDAAPVATRVSRLLLDALEQGASDIHLEPRSGRMQVRFRLDGVLYRQVDIPSGLEDALVSRIKIMARLDIAERRLPQDGNARVRVGEREVDIRVSSLPVADGERLVLRLLGRENTRFSLSGLGMPARMLEPFRALIHQPHGVIWVTGPTGSGKTTTLYAALQELDTARRNVLTIEDPVEYQLPNIGQVGVQSRIGLTFAAGLRSLLRQDPDVILVGETRDEETAEIVVRASMTGHLVLSTLHANDAVSASLRLCDMGVESFLVAEATRGALAQRLVRRLCPKCARETNAANLPTPLASLEGIRLREPVGCAECREGYRGRVGLFELLRVGPEIRACLRRGDAAEKVLEAARAEGFRDIWADAFDKVRDGVTSLAEVRAALGEGD